MEDRATIKEQIKDLLMRIGAYTVTLKKLESNKGKSDMDTLECLAEACVRAECRCVISGFVNEVIRLEKELEQE